jgi:hypothetical protein
LKARLNGNQLSYRQRVQSTALSIERKHVPISFQAGGCKNIAPVGNCAAFNQAVHERTISAGFHSIYFTFPIGRHHMRWLQGLI